MRSPQKQSFLKHGLTSPPLSPNPTGRHLWRPEPALQGSPGHMKAGSLGRRRTWGAKQTGPDAKALGACGGAAQKSGEESCMAPRGSFPPEGSSLALLCATVPAPQLFTGTKDWSPDVHVMVKMTGKGCGHSSGHALPPMGRSVSRGRASLRTRCVCWWWSPGALPGSIGFSGETGW